MLIKGHRFFYQSKSCLFSQMKYSSQSATSMIALVALCSCCHLVLYFNDQPQILLWAFSCQGMFASGINGPVFNFCSVVTLLCFNFIVDIKNSINKLKGYKRNSLSGYPTWHQSVYNRVEKTLLFCDMYIGVANLISNIHAVRGIVHWLNILLTQCVQCSCVDWLFC